MMTKISNLEDHLLLSLYFEYKEKVKAFENSLYFLEDERFSEFNLRDRLNETRYELNRRGMNYE